MSRPLRCMILEVGRKCDCRIVTFGIVSFLLSPVFPAQPLSWLFPEEASLSWEFV